MKTSRSIEHVAPGRVRRNEGEGLGGLSHHDPCYVQPHHWTTHLRMEDDYEVDILCEDRESVTHRGEPHIDSIEVGGDVTLYSNSAPSHALEEGAVHEDEDLRVDRGRH